MVHFKSLFGAALLATAVYARPMPQDSAVGAEVGVAAPNGTPITDSVELASQSAAEAAAQTPAYEPAVTSSAVHEQSTQPAAHETAAPSPPVANHETTTQVHEQPKATYGSGSNTWGNGEQYNDCVQQCIATYGAPPATWSPTATAGHAGSTPTGAPGATHTVIVAPQQGVLRYVPFAVNASVGDTILFRWNANNHTVTKSEQLSLCNKTSNALFASGLQNKDFEFTQVVNSTDPTYFYCAAPNHCQKGMFGIINPPNAFGAPTTVAGQMQNVTAKNPNVAAMASYTNKMTEGSPAANWGRSINLADMPEWSHELVMENVFYTRTFLAENPETMSEDGVSLSGASTTPLKFPEDISTALNNAGTTDPVSGGAVNAGSSPAASGSSGTDAPAASGAANAGNDAMSMSPSMTLSAFTLAAFFFLL